MRQIFEEAFEKAENDFKVQKKILDQTRKKVEDAEKDFREAKNRCGKAEGIMNAAKKALDALPDD